MTINQFAFVPPNGLRDASYAPTDPPNEAALRQAIQGIPDQLKDYINNVLLPTLASTTASSSGAREIGSETIAPLSGNTVYAQLVSLVEYINSISIGVVPNDSITNAKLGTDVKVGSLAALNTVDKTSVVNAINETNTASNMLDKIKTVDGIGSGIDADLWRGWKIYNSLDELGLTESTATIDQIHTALPSTSILNCAINLNPNMPTANFYYHLVVSKTSDTGQSTFKATSRLTSSGLNTYEAEYNVNDTPKFTGWKPVVLDNPTVTTITSGFASGWSGTISATKNHNNLLDFGIDLTKNVDISTSETIYTLAVGLRPTKTINILINLATSSYDTVSNSFAILQIATTGTVGIIPVSSTNLVNARKIAFTQCMYYTA